MKLSSLLHNALPAMASIAIIGASGTASAQEPASAAAAPAIKASEVKVAGQDVPVPPRRKYVAPEYPADAALQGIRGIVIVELVIGEDGRVLTTRVTRSIPGLDEAAVAAVRLWEYEPTKVAGKGVKVQLSQSITFALRLPELQRAPGIPELKSGGAPPVPPSLASAESASVAVTLGPQGQVVEAGVIDGNPVVSEALLRAVKTWRFALAEGAAPPSFTIRAEWSPGPPPVLTLKALEPKALAMTTGAPATAATQAAPVTPAGPGKDAVPVTAPAAVAPSAPVDTEVIPARPEPPVKEQGVSAVADVMLGDNIPDLARGRRPTWPPLARLGNVTGDVVVRFSVDLAGKVTVHSAEGPDLLKSGAEQAVATWLFRRTAIDRLHLIATFKFGGDRSLARVERVMDPS